MQTAAMTNRFLTGCSSKVELADPEIVVSHSELLRHLVASHLAQTVHSQELFVRLTNELIRFAEQAYVMRDVEALDDVSHTLMNLPVDAARQIGRYYYSLAIYRRGQRDEADALLEKIADEGPITYRARAIQTLGANHHASGQLDEALRFQLEVLRVASDENAHGLQPTLMAGFEISIIKSLEGDHRGAMSGLRSLSPLVDLVARQKPFYFYLYCSELAIELGELGHIAEAHAALNVALASPYAPAYPNWAETRQELEAKRTSATPSVVAINHAPKPDPSVQGEPQRQPEPVGSVAFSWPARKEDPFQGSIIPIVAAAALNRLGITLLILYCLGKCVRTRGPPALSQGAFRSISRSKAESAQEKARAEQNQFSTQEYCAKSCRLIDAISICVSLCRNCRSRAPLLRRDGASDAGSVNRLITTSNLPCCKADDRHDSYRCLIHRRKVTPRSQFAPFQKIWTSRRDGLPTLAARVRVEGTSVEPTRVRVQEDTYD